MTLCVRVAGDDSTCVRACVYVSLVSCGGCENRSREEIFDPFLDVIGDLRVDFYILVGSKWFHKVFLSLVDSLQ